MDSHETASSGRELSDSAALNILLKLSDIQPPEWEPHIPFLDSATVSQVSNSITNILSKGRPDLKKLVLRLLRKWCTGNNKSSALGHTAWIGRSLTVEDCIESVLSSCISLIRNEEDWNKRDSDQQLALCYAILGAATNFSLSIHEEAGEICILLVNRILKQRELRLVHHRFLGQIWNSVGELPLKIDFLTEMAERSFLGIERTMLWLGRKAVKSNQQNISESFDTIVGSTLLKICSRSPYVFQNICNILTHMLVLSKAHPGVQALTKAFISGVEMECKRGNFDVSALYEKSCQILSALLCVDPTLLPDYGENILSRDTILQMLNELPRKKAAALLSHRPAWLLFTF